MPTTLTAMQKLALRDHATIAVRERSNASDLARNPTAAFQVVDYAYHDLLDQIADNPALLEEITTQYQIRMATQSWSTAWEGRPPVQHSIC